MGGSLIPGVVRVFGVTIGATPAEANAFYFDMDLMAGAAGEVTFMNLSAGTDGNTMLGQASADGTLLPVYQNALWSDTGSIYGDFKLLDLTRGEAVEAGFPQTVSIFRWQP